MDTTTLGKTGLTVSVAGLGCGGDSRVGLGKGKARADSVRLIREAFDLGVTLFDTARGYGTEEILGEAIKAMPRDRIVVTTKLHARGDATAADMAKGLEESLRALDTDYVDVFQIHALHPDDYDHAMAELVPAMIRLREAGKCRFIGVTETGPKDPQQRMLRRAVQDDVWQVMMLAFHMMHQGARDVIDAAYRFARHEPGADVVLFGTANPAHLKANIESLNRPPLPAADIERLAALFGHLQGVGLEFSARGLADPNGPAGR